MPKTGSQLRRRQAGGAVARPDENDDALGGPALQPVPSSWMTQVLLIGLWMACVASLSRRMGISVKTDAEQQQMRAAGRMAAEVLEVLAPHVRAGVSTGALDAIAQQHIVGVQHAVAAPLHYGGIVGGALLSAGAPGRSACKIAAHGMHTLLSSLSWLRGAVGGAAGGGFFFGIPLCGFPASVCVSVNEEVCHGIPGPGRVLRAGDLANVDVTVINGAGFHGDTSELFAVGGARALSERAAALHRVSRESLFLALRLVRPGTRLGDIGAVIAAHARENGFSVVREYSGHGIGTAFHEGPRVLHFGAAGEGVELSAGMTLTIEPMLNELGAAVRVLGDQWTVVTRDGGLSAQWEHTILVTPWGSEVLTMRKGETAPDAAPMGLPRHNCTMNELLRVRSRLQAAAAKISTSK